MNRQIETGRDKSRQVETGFEKLCIIHIINKIISRLQIFKKNFYYEILMKKIIFYIYMYISKQ